MPLKVLKLERIGNPGQGFQPAWVDHVTGIGPQQIIKQRIRGNVDYSQANSVGSRGVYEYFFLQEQEVYHVSSPETWKRADQYFCRIDQGEIVRMSMEEVVEWLLKRRWERMSSLHPESV